MAKSAGNGESLLDCKEFRFTPERLREACRLVAERGGRQAWRDEGCKQLQVRIGSRGGVFYRFGQDAVRHRLVRERIGEVSGPNAVPLEAARKKCEQLRVDPKARAALPRRRIGSGGPTIKEAWERYTTAIESGRFSMRRGRKPLNASTITAYKHVYGAHLKSHEEKTLHWLAANLKDLFETIGTQGSADHGKASPGPANKLLQICKNLFEFCRQQGEWEAANPAIDPRTGSTYAKFQLPKREARLTREQTRRLVKAMNAEGSFWEDFFTIAALTGRRLSNVRNLRWENIDLSEGLILDSASVMKNGRPNHGVLAEVALSVLKRRKQQAAEGAEWVFPGRKPGTPIRNPYHAWADIRKAAGMPKLRIHDLRHNAGSWAMGKNKAEAAVGRYLSHQSGTSTRRYQHANTDDARNVAQAVNDQFVEFANDLRVQA